MWQGHMPIFLLFTPLDLGHHAKGYNIPMAVLKKKGNEPFEFLFSYVVEEREMADWID